MLSASYVTLRNGMCFHPQLIIVSGSGTLADHVAYINQEYASMRPIISEGGSTEIHSVSLSSIYGQLEIDPLETNQIVFLNKD